MPPANLQNLSIACGAIAFCCWLASVATREYSWVDRLWSILPPAYVVWIVATRPVPDPRLWVLMVLSILWGARLTFNFARKGGYAAGGEDYRWLALRRQLTPWQFQLLNFFFVAGVQNAILLALVLPAWALAQRPATALGFADAALVLLFLLLLALETVADEQQWRFQRDKHARLARGEPVTALFLTTGLFRYSRHPNFFCEQALWWVFYAIVASATGQWLHWTLAGPCVLTALFHGSTNFTESLSLDKYPSYADYQARVSRLIPMPRRSSDRTPASRPLA